MMEGWQNVRDSVSGRTRKRKRNLENWKRTRLQGKRYEDVRPGTVHQWKHKGNFGKYFHCQDLSAQDIQSFHVAFYKCQGRKEQESFMANYIKATKTKKGKRRRCDAKYYVRDAQGLRVKVCRNAFCSVLSISERRVRTVVSNLFRHATPQRDRRGGDRRSYKFAERRNNIKGWIGQLKARESHYNRQKSARQYLPHELKSVRNIWSIYNAEQPATLQVKYKYFLEVFNTDFNLSISTPRSDVCSYCLRLDEQLKAAKTMADTVATMTEKRIHRLRAKAFYQLLRGKQIDETTLCLTFDCMQNQVLPKVPDQQAFYSRQLYYYVLGVVKCKKDQKMDQNNVIAYTWTDDQAAKGSNEIASAVWHRLQNSNLEGKTSVALFSDGCGGQNKNRMLIGMVCHWLCNNAPQNVKEVVLFFPVTGHSFLPSDRFFGVLEKSLRKEESIISPTEYDEIVSKISTNLSVGVDFGIRDWKSFIGSVTKKKLPFAVQRTKRFIVTRGKKTRTALVRAEASYKSDLSTPVSLCSRGKTWRSDPPKEKTLGNPVKQAKLTDVSSLLCKHFGNDWKELGDKRLDYYRRVFEAQEDHTIEQAHDVNSDCDCLSEDPVSYV